ncbi:cytochrome c oxidase subunit 7B, mitochondrial [Rhineura floridana]|uniref:cytochrome c oxidase subunit 7B, mitochondrial n=1 Tax=Rhineura floridana TaxID=261503 RepID=UPI002AC80BCF|nr:cytochrome c oxidase subunit 7B, mitochondrial [Rhineura floridana]
MRRPTSSCAVAILFFTASQGYPGQEAEALVRSSAAKMLFPLASSALRLTARGILRTLARQAHHKHEPDFHDKYGNIILLGGAIFCVSIWTYVATQTGMEWNLSPVGRITPKEWKEE